MGAGSLNFPPQISQPEVHAEIRRVAELPPALSGRRKATGSWIISLKPNSPQPPPALSDRGPTFELRFLESTI